MNKREILVNALVGRDEEIFNYQINIDNYERAIEKIDKEYGDKPEIIEFRDYLIHLTESNKTEQLKTRIIRDVIADQLDEMGEV